jgi:hypothetical protein
MTWHCGERDRDLAGAELTCLFAWGIIDREKGPLRHSIGLQSGATGGAVSWGVLDRLLEDEQIESEAVSGPSWGSVTADAITRGYYWSGSGMSSASVSGAVCQVVPCGGGVWAGQPRLCAAVPGEFGFRHDNFSLSWNPFGYHIVRETLPEIVDSSGCASDVRCACSSARPTFRRRKRRCSARMS